MFSNPRPRKLCRLRDSVENCGGARDAEDYDMAVRLSAGLVRLHAPTHMHAPGHPLPHARAHTQKYLITYLLLLHGNSGYANAPLLRYAYIVCLVTRKRCFSITTRSDLKTGVESAAAQQFEDRQTHTER